MVPLPVWPAISEGITPYSTLPGKFYSVILTSHYKPGWKLFIYEYQIPLSGLSFLWCEVVGLGQPLSGVQPELSVLSGAIAPAVDHFGLLLRLLFAHLFFRPPTLSLIATCSSLLAEDLNNVVSLRY